ncbi:hypothetical protein RZS08_21085 [Arthrospira platensis SPKY1]|nr:hypothetical protein [Arthrospira platensis SPKY1]
MQAARRTAHALAQPIEPLPLAIQRIPHGGGHSLLQVGQLAQALLTRRRTQFRRRRGRRGTKIGRKVTQREVGLVAHATDHRHGSTGDRTHHLLVIEGPEVLECPATPNQQQHIDVPSGLVPPIGSLECCRQLGGG